MKSKLALLSGILLCVAVGSAQASSIDVNSPFVFTGIYSVGTWWGTGGGGGGGGASPLNVFQNTVGTSGSLTDSGPSWVPGNFPGSDGIANGPSSLIPLSDNLPPGFPGSLTGFEGLTNGQPLNDPLEGGLTDDSILGNAGPAPAGDPVPEPTSLVLLGTGLGVLAVAGWRRK